MGHRYHRTPQHSTEQKARTEKNRQKPPKAKKFARIETVERKLQEKEIKRRKYLRKLKK